MASGAFRLLGNLTAVLCLGSGVLRAQTVLDGALQIETYAEGFTSPGFFEFLPQQGVAVELFIGEILTGRILHYRDAVFQGTACDFDVAGFFERGLLGIALHPGFPEVPFVYAYYTKSNTAGDTDQIDGALENRVVRLSWNGSTLVEETVLLSLPVGTNHNGGVLLFGPDDMLYGSIGEAGSVVGQLQNIPNGTPPNDTSIIFRLRADGTAPDDNPFFALGGAMQKVYAYGTRNVFGLDFDPVSDVLWDTDNGPADYDEINRVPAGMNGGWQQIMGPDVRDPQGVGDLWMVPGAVYVDPAFSFFESFGITTISFMRGSGIGAHYDGDAFVAAHNSMDIYHFEVSADRTTLVMPEVSVADRVSDTSTERDLFLWGTDMGVVTDIETGPDGALYILRISGIPQIYRVFRPATSDAGSRLPEHRMVASPNPFRTSVQIRVPERALAVTVRIFTADGRLVRALPVAATGPAPILWDGRDARGHELAAGVYWAELSRSGDIPLRSRLVRLR